MEVNDWLLEGEPWVVYRTLMDLIRQPAESPEVETAYQALTSHPQIQNLLDELQVWPGDALKNHKKAGHLLHKLVFLSDLGLKPDHPQVSAIVEKVKANQSPEGPFQIVVNLPTHFGGSGKDEMSWMLCDAGSTLYALANFGETEDPRIFHAADYLASLCREDGGWPCAATAELGKFKGPGRRDDPCPYTNLLMVKALLSLAPAIPMKSIKAPKRSSTSGGGGARQSPSSLQWAPVLKSSKRPWSGMTLYTCWMSSPKSPKLARNRKS